MPSRFARAFASSRLANPPITFIIPYRMGYSNGADVKGSKRGEPF